MLVAVMFFAVVPVVAQQQTSESKEASVPKLNIRGTVFENQTLQPMEGANVRLFNALDSLVAGNVTKGNGQFLLPNVPAGTYTMRVSFIGCKEQAFTLNLPRRSGNFKVNDILLREDATVMKEAVVEGKLPEMTVVDDTVMYNADAFKVEDGAMIEELIKKLPGIDVDANGNFTWNGKSISQILVDGKEFFGNNKNLVLQNLPAEIVDKIKAYDKKSDHARITGIDDGNERTVLDLAIKKDKKRGWFGNTTAGMGTAERYTGRINVNRFKGEQKFSVVGNANNTGGDGMTDDQTVGATMNRQSKTLELNGSLDGRFRQNSNESRSNSQNFEMKNSAYSNNHSWNGGRNSDFSFRYKVEWKPDSTWNILFQPEASLSNSSSHNDNESAAFRDDPYVFTTDPLRDYASLDNSIRVNHRRGSSRSESDGVNASASLQVNKRLAKPGRNVTLNVGGGYNRNENESSNYSQTDYYQILAHDGGDSVYHKVQYNHNPGRSHNFNVRASYSEPIAMQTYLQLSYNYSYNLRDNRREVRSIFDPYNDMLGTNADNYESFFDAPYVERDRQQCNYTTNRYQNHDIRAQIRFNRTRYQLTIGGNVRPQVSRIDYQKGRIDTVLTRTVANVSPTVNFRYKFSREEQLDFRYNANTGQPNMTDMIPDTLSDANPLNIRIGNAGLKPSFTQNMNLDYRRSVPGKQRSSALNMQFRTTKNSTTNRTEYNEVTGGRISMPVNVNGNWNASANFNFNTALDTMKHWRINSSTSTSMTNAIGYLYRSKDTTTVMNRTRGGHISQSLRLTYRREWESKWNVEFNASGSFQYNISRSNNATASNLDHHSFSYGGSFLITTPWGMTIGSDMNEHCRRGYSDAAMNTNQLIWNASISQRLLPHKILTLTLRAVDILEQRDNVNRNVSATSRTDTQNRIVRSYVLFSAYLRFGKFGGRGSRPRGEQADRAQDGPRDRRTAESRPSDRGGRSGGEGRSGGYRGGGRM